MTEIDDWIYLNETQAPGQPLPPKDGDDKKSGKDEKSGNDEKKG